jgi:hypothetical protein
MTGWLLNHGRCNAASIVLAAMAAAMTLGMQPTRLAIAGWVLAEAVAVRVQAQALLRSYRERD